MPKKKPSWTVVEEEKTFYSGLLQEEAEISAEPKLNSNIVWASGDL